MKTNINTKYKCPGKNDDGTPCDYGSDWKAAVMNHIIGNHPGVWQGNWDATFGVPGAKPGRTPRAVRKNKTVTRRAFRQWVSLDRLAAKGRPAKYKGREQERKNERQAIRRAENIAKGLTSGGFPRKRPLRENYLRAHGMVHTPISDKHQKKLERQREWYKRNKQKIQARKRIEPIVYRAEVELPQEDKLRDLMENLKRQLSFRLKHCPNCGLDLVEIQESLQKQQTQKQKEQHEEEE